MDIDKSAVSLWKDKKIDRFISPQDEYDFYCALREFTLKIVNNLRTVVRWATMLVTAATVLCGIAAADTLVVTGIDASRGESIWISENGTDQNAFFAGVINITLTDAEGNQFNRDTMCVQLFTDIFLYQMYQTSVVTPDEMGGGAFDRVSWLLDNELPLVTTPAQGAGLQLAIWDIMEDGGNGFLTGSVQEGSAAHPTDQAVLDAATAYEVDSFGKSSGDAFVYQNTSNGVQVQMLEGPKFLNDGGPQPIPEVSTLVLAGTVLAGTVLVGMVLAALGLVGWREVGMLGGRSAEL